MSVTICTQMSVSHLSNYCFRKKMALFDKELLSLICAKLKNFYCIFNKYIYLNLNFPIKTLETFLTLTNVIASLGFLSITSFLSLSSKTSLTQSSWLYNTWTPLPVITTCSLIPFPVMSTYLTPSTRASMDLLHSSSQSVPSSTCLYTRSCCP